MTSDWRISTFWLILTLVVVVGGLMIQWNKLKRSHYVQPFGATGLINHLYPHRYPFILLGEVYSITVKWLQPSFGAAVILQLIQIRLDSQLFVSVTVIAWNPTAEESVPPELFDICRINLLFFRHVFTCYCLKLFLIHTNQCNNTKK